ncbi:MAG: tetratricopeptide repeat protein [Candidatus Eisenbacteria bacterium]|nr:tetratricopeptide repeat protein [Candidatus Eisenbacteria bacterium]
MSAETNQRDDSLRAPDRHDRFRRALIEYRSAPRLLRSLSKCLAAEGRFEEALECVFESLTVDPAQPALLLRAAEWLAILGRHEDAVRFCERYQALRPTSPRGYVRMGDCLLRQGYLWSAADAYIRALSCRPESRLLRSRVRRVMRLCEGAEG